MRPAGIFTRHQEAFQVASAMGVYLDPTHLVVGGGRDLHPFPGQVLANVFDPFHHAREFFFYKLGAQVACVQVYPVVRCTAPCHNLHIAGSCNPVPSRSFQMLGIVAFHVAFVKAIIKTGPSTSETFFQKAST